MQTPPLPSDEDARLGALRSVALLDTPPEPDFDGFVKLASGIARAPIALVSLVDETRQWFKARHGLEPTETSRDISFCGHAILDDTPLIVGDALEDERFADNPLVLGDPRIRFYAGFPLQVEGQAIGTLCVIDHEPRELDARDTLLLSDLADQISYCLMWRRRLLERGASQIDPPAAPPHGLAEMVVHDLAAPLTTILVNAGLIATDVQAETSTRAAATDIQTASGLLQRMVLNLLDVSHTSAPDLLVERQEVSVAALIDKVRAAVRGVLHARQQQLVISADRGQLSVDVDLIVRVLQNIVDNASKYAPPGSALRLGVAFGERAVCFTVDDEGPGVPDHAREKIFDPGVRLDRDAARHPRTSHGLGLAFCKLSVEAHGGTIRVETSPGGLNRFVVELPWTPNPEA